MATTPAAVVDVVLDRGHLMIWRLPGGRWRVAYDDVDETGQYVVPLLEKALGPRSRADVFRYGVRAMEAANPDSSFLASVVTDSGGASPARKLTRRD